MGIATVLFTLGLLLVVLSRDEESSAIDAGRLANAHAGKKYGMQQLSYKNVADGFEGCF